MQWSIFILCLQIYLNLAKPRYAARRANKKKTSHLPRLSIMDVSRVTRPDFLYLYLYLIYTPSSTAHPPKHDRP